MPEPPVVYVNTGSLLPSAHDLLLRLGIAVGEDTQPVTTLAMSYSFAAALYTQLGEVLRDASGEDIPAAEGVAPSLTTWREFFATREATIVEQLPWIVEQRRAGLTLRVIAEQLGIGEAKLWRVLKKHAPTLTGHQARQQGGRTDD